MKTVAKITGRVVIGILSILGALVLVIVLGRKVGWIVDTHPDSISFTGPLEVLNKLNK